MANVSPSTNHLSQHVYLQQDVANGGVISFPYPDGYNNTYAIAAAGAGNHYVVVNGTKYTDDTLAPQKISVTLGLSSIDVTWNGGYTLPKDTLVVLHVQGA